MLEKLSQINEMQSDCCAYYHTQVNLLWIFELGTVLYSFLQKTNIYLPF